MTNYKLRFIPLGGIVGVTKNMYVYELYESSKLPLSLKLQSASKAQSSNHSMNDGYVLKDIIIVDCGIGFPTEKELGVDFVIPDISYLKDKVNKIRAVILSHGHEDHTSALPFHYQNLGRPQIYASKLTSVFVENKFKEYGQKVKVNEVIYGKDYVLGNFKLQFIRLTHSIPDTLHVLIKTPIGNIYHGTDFKFDLTPPYGKWPDFYAITKAGNDGVLCLLSDSLGAEREGLTLSENIVGQTFEDEMRKTKGKFFMTTFSSNISRIRQCVEAAIKFNRKIIFLGRSMKENTKLAAEIGYLPIPYSLIIKEQEIIKQAPNKVCIIIAGSQGQYDSALSKLARDQNPNIKLKPGDRVIFSSDPIPGNEAEVYALMEELALKGADVVYPDVQEQLHASGHGNQEDLKLLMRFTDPRYFIPIGGTIRHQRQYEKLAIGLGYKKEQVFLLNEGDTVWFGKNAANKGQAVETRNVYVDAYGIGDVGNVVLRDRKTLSSEGVVVAVLAVDSQRRLVSRPKVLSRGFIYEKDKLFEVAMREIERIIKPRAGSVLDVGNLKKEVGAQLETLFYKQTGKEPLVVVDVIQI